MLRQRRMDCVLSKRPTRMSTKKPSRIVLVMVDDDEDDCLLVEAALYEALLKCDFRCVENGLDMVDYLHRRGRFIEPESSPRPDIILLDLNMPKMNGRDLLKVVKNNTEFRSIPVIVLTTSAAEEDVAFCYDLGANTYITKQRSFEGLLASIKVIKEYWLETATLPPRKDLPKAKRKTPPPHSSGN